MVQSFTGVVDEDVDAPLRLQKVFGADADGLERSQVEVDAADAPGVLETCHCAADVLDGSLSLGRVPAGDHHPGPCIRIGVFQSLLRPPQGLGGGGSDLPLETRSSAVALPMPVLPPVMTTVLPSRLPGTTTSLPKTLPIVAFAGLEAGTTERNPFRFLALPALLCYCGGRRERDSAGPPSTHQ